MKILYYYPSHFPVKMYGGTPRVIQWLTREMANMGHEVYLMALSGSSLEGVEVIGIEEDSSPEQIVSRVPDKVDLVHLFANQTILDFKKPIIVTFDRLHRVENFHPNTVFVSKRHAQLHNSTYYVHHGLPYQDFPCSGEKLDYFAYIGPVNSFGKNVEVAIRLAKDTGINLMIAGGYRFSLWNEIRSMGIIGESKKKELLNRARGLIFPVLWDEPFGLVMIEALACGTPVIATPFGSIPEVISPDCGFICSSHDEMRSAVKNIDKISHDACRKKVETYFNSRRMAEQYLTFYAKIVEHGYFDPNHHPYLSPGVDNSKIFHHYEGFKPASWLWETLGPRINSFYTRYEESVRVYAEDEIPTHDLTHIG